ncbi:MAG: isopentenyl phosphate kinase [Phototrophicaceae bacterium]
MVTLLKLGGSLITDKTQEATLRPQVLNRLAQEINQAYQAIDLPLLIGHGSGSFGHFEAKRHDTIKGVKTLEQWAGFASVGRIAAELNFHVATALGLAGLPVLRIQPSASAITSNGIIQDMALQPILRALAHQIIPLVYGDVAFDDVLGGTITSTETVFQYLVAQLPVKRILLVGEVDGVLDENGHLIEQITPQNFDGIRSALGGSSGVDVTGGMLTKVQDMLALANQAPYPDVYIINGMVENRVYQALVGDSVGTHISR